MGRFSRRRGFHDYAGENPFSPVISPVAIACINYFIDFRPSSLLTEGLFRVPGDLKRTAKLWRGLRKQKKGVNVMDFEPHEVASCFKEYFRSLDNPLCTIELYDCFVAAAGIPAQYVEERRACLRKVLDLLPPGNYVLLKRLMAFLRIVASHSARNRMNTLNLALVFAPSILSPLKSDMRAAVVTIDDLTESSHIVETVSFLLDNFEMLFYSPDHGKPMPRISLTAAKNRAATLERSSSSVHSVCTEAFEHSTTEDSHSSDDDDDDDDNDNAKTAAVAASSSSSSSGDQAAAASQSVEKNDNEEQPSGAIDPKLDRAKGVFDRALRRGTRVVTTSLEQFAQAVEMGVQQVLPGDELPSSSSSDDDSVHDEAEESFYWKAKAKVDSALGTQQADGAQQRHESIEDLLAKSSLLAQRLAAPPPSIAPPPLPVDVDAASSSSPPSIAPPPLPANDGSAVATLAPPSMAPPPLPADALLPPSIAPPLLPADSVGSMLGAPSALPHDDVGLSSSDSSAFLLPALPSVAAPVRPSSARQTDDDDSDSPAPQVSSPKAARSRSKAPRQRKHKTERPRRAALAVQKWSVDEVRKWVASLGHDKLDEVFARNDIDGEVLLALSDADLVTLGVTSLGSRKKILLRIAALIEE